MCNEKEKDKPMGIDRIDNTKGYIIDNCRACCTMCNMIKGDENNDDIMKRIICILTNLKIISKDLDYDIFKNYKSTNKEGYEQRATKKNIEFVLTEKEFNVIKSLDCYLCGKVTNKEHSNGIDRIDSKNEYNINNVLPCCADCNYMKNNFDIYDFINKIYEMYMYTFKVNKEFTNEQLKLIIDKHIVNIKNTIQSKTIL
jgi:hypothetical protein